MWTKINNLDIVAEIRPGNVIAEDPDILCSACVVKSVTPHYIKAIDNNRKKIVVIFPQSEVISGKWWVQQ